MGTVLSPLEAEHGDPLAALDHIAPAIRNFCDSDNVGLMRSTPTETGRPSRIVITGCQRSGTTLMGLILDSHPVIRHVDEANFDRNKPGRSLRATRSKRALSFKLPQESANLELVQTKLGATDIVWMVRDPRDVVASMCRLKMRMTPSLQVAWAGAFAPVEITRMLERYPSDAFADIQPLLARYHRILAMPATHRSDEEHAFVGALCWKLKQRGLRIWQRQASVAVHVVRYEELVRNPAAALRDLMQDLGLRWSPALLRHHQLHTGTSIGATRNDRAIDEDSVGQWAALLTTSQLRVIDEVCGDEAASATYRLERRETWIRRIRSRVRL
ncbi:sulfotransferase family protein [Mycobacterium sp.]|uniref:sulfotransferase family protein n=1 Tax=Mycobacterium sp. TaxID=1785 RepID=UPI003F7E3174